MIAQNEILVECGKERTSKHEETGVTASKLYNQRNVCNYSVCLLRVQ